jgi:hypothetical protein
MIAALIGHGPNNDDLYLRTTSGRIAVTQLPNRKVGKDTHYKKEYHM